MIRRTISDLKTLALLTLVLLPVCAAALTVQDWSQARAFREGRACRQADLQTAPNTPPAATVPVVWVNTASGVYHLPGTRWYGATAQGEFLGEDEAKRQGYRPANNWQ